MTAINVQGTVTLRVEDGGAMYIVFETEQGYAVLNIENLLAGRGPVTRSILQDWINVTLDKARQ